MTGLDVAILAVVGISTLIAAARGLIRSLFSLVGWVVALICATVLGGAVAMLLPGDWSELTRRLAGYALVFGIVLIVVSLVGRALARFVQSVGLGGVDRALGALFGLARGALIVSVVVLVATLTPLAQIPAWRASVFVPWIADLLHQVVPSLSPGGHEVIEA